MNQIYLLVLFLQEKADLSILHKFASIMLHNMSFSYYTICYHSSEYLYVTLTFLSIVSTKRSYILKQKLKVAGLIK